MAARRTPMRWPATWKDPATLALLKGTAVDCLLLEKGAGLGPIAARAQQEGLMVAEAGAPPPGVTVTDGEWPGVKLTASGTPDRVSAGPTGVPWVDANGWKIRLMAALHPGTDIWVEAVPVAPRLFPESYIIGVADAAAHGGRWIISLDERMAAGVAAGNPEALRAWKTLTGAAGFFSAHEEWLQYVPAAVVGIISDFGGQNETMSHEILNLVARTNQQYRIILKKGFSKACFQGLRAVIYADEDPPAPDLRKEALAFVRSGAMLITGPRWGELPGRPLAGVEHPRYELRAFGRGRLAVSRADLDDPYLIASDSMVLISHRHALVRFWNAGAVGSHLAVTPDRKRAVLQMVFYARLFGDNRPSVRIAGRYRQTRLWTLDQESPGAVETETQRNAVEAHLPPVTGYAAVELEV
ncbi:MAG: hypothetical protein HXY20_04955 [Acidobacteria bacterium]|nr:hypothetical protein [Acidobacteriota bacterium]